jgi:hypothetical protein
VSKLNWTANGNVRTATVPGWDVEATVHLQPDGTVDVTAKAHRPDGTRAAMYANRLSEAEALDAVEEWASRLDGLEQDQ